MDIESSFPNKDDSENSEGNLEIVIENETRKKKKQPPTPTESEKRIIESIEDELERRLEEKAAKTNLNAVNVKNIIKHVVTNEHVLYLIRNVDNSITDSETAPALFEPKLTRSKAKELCSTLEVPLPSVPWVSPKTSAVQALLKEDLQEDSSGDEYVPGVGDEEKEDESEDDRDSSIFSDPPSVEPPTSPYIPSNESGTQTNWTEDGIFKIPCLPKDKEEVTAEANIALRTRSKLCLSSTPLEVIEDAFIPPDITTDMYEMDCDNEDWMNFLKTFNRPLDEIVRAPEVEEEELDPEYNVLADEEVDKPDKEELRVDKAVKVSRKELNDLMAELYEFCTNEQAYLETIEEDDERGCNQFSINPLTNNTLENSQFDSTVIGENSMSNSINNSDNNEMKNINHDTTKITNSESSEFITKIQISLLEQQIRQHVQLLTQNFIITYQHPELHLYSMQMKEYLLNFNLLAETKPKSIFRSINLENAIKMISYWENIISSDTEEVKKMKSYVLKVINESLRNKQTGNEYIVTFPSLILETICKSDVFLYASLLPKIPFKSPRYFSSKLATFADSEMHLIAMGLEEFMPMAEELLKSQSKRKAIQLTTEYIHEFILPIKNPQEIYRKILRSDCTRCANNPIKQYFITKKAQTFIQFVIPLEELKILPPCQRKPEELPYQWRNYVYPIFQDKNFSNSLPLITFAIKHPGIQVTPTPIVTNNIQKRLFSKGPLCSSTPVCPRKRVSRIKRLTRKQSSIRANTYFNQDPITKFVKCLGQPSPLKKILELFASDSSTQDNGECGLSNNKNIKTEKLNIRDQRNSINKSFEIQIPKIVYRHKNLNETDPQLPMLPNMPSLFTPIKLHSQNDDEQIPQEKADTVKTNISIGTLRAGINFSTCLNNKSESEQTASETKGFNDTKDDEKYIKSLLIASSTIKSAPKKEPSGAEKKRAKLKKEYLANLSISTPDAREAEKQKNEMFALTYYDKMRETLEIESYHKIMQILNDYEEGDAVDLYYKIEAVLRPKYKDLADEFLLFLREREASAVGRLVPWIRMSNRSKFLRKLEIYFRDQPSQLKKIYQCLTELSQTIGISMEKIKTTLIPMFKGNAVLTDLFLQNFMDEPPPPSLLEGPYELFDLNKEISRPEEEKSFENIIVPDVADKYGGLSCICSCHEIEDAEYKSRIRHCTRCGTKFINGKVFMQTGRGLRPARVSFLTNPKEDHQARLADKSILNFIKRKKRTSERSPLKPSTSTAKENPDEDTDEDGDKKKKPKRKPPQRHKKEKSSGETPAKETKKTASNKGKNVKEKTSTPKKRTNSIKKAISNRKIQKELKHCEIVLKEHSRNETEVEEHNETKMEEHNETELEEHIEIELEEHNEIELEEHNETELEELNETELEEHNETELEEHNETELEEHNETELEEHNEIEIEDQMEVKKDTNILKPGSSKYQKKRLYEESWEEGEQGAVGGSSGEVKIESPPGHHLADSESEFLEESSQDNCESDSNSSMHSTPKSYAEVLEQNSSWKREEDKIILEVFQKENDKDHAFRAISNQLSNRSVDEIKSRFDTLMDLLMKTVNDHRD